MAEVIGIKFKDGGKVYFFDPCGVAVAMDQAVIVETARGIECGIVATANHEVADDQIVRPLKKLVRVANPKDVAQMEENHRREESAFAVCQRKIAEHKMDMKLVDVEYTFDNSKVLFYFTADGRVDFRDLVKDLAGIFRTRIELRQIGVRDEAKMLGGLGICGRVFCCSSFLSDFQPVSIKMAKEQGLSLNPTKISGTCGRLMCCLKYEQNAYEDLIRNTPKVGTPVCTPEGNGVVVEISNLITGSLKVRVQSGEGFAYKIFPKHELTPLRAGEGDVAPAPSRAQQQQETRAPRPKRAPEGEQAKTPRQGQQAQGQNRPPRQDAPAVIAPPVQGEPAVLAEGQSAPDAGDAPPRPRSRRRSGRGRSNRPKVEGESASAPSGGQADS